MSRLAALHRRAAGQAAHHARACIAFRRLFAVEALDEQDILAADCFDPAFGGREVRIRGPSRSIACSTRVLFQRSSVAVEFRHPQILPVLHHGLRASAAHRRAEQQQVLDLLRLRVVRNLIFDQRGGERLKFFKIDRLVEFPQRERAGSVEPEAERAGPVVRAIPAGSPARRVGLCRRAFRSRGGPNSPVRHPAARRRRPCKLSGFVGARREFELDGVELDRVRVLQIGAPVDKAPEGVAVCVFGSRIVPP